MKYYIRKGSLLKRKITATIDPTHPDGEYATVITKPFTKVYTDFADEAANAAGFDSCTAARAIRICFHKSGVERTYKYADAVRLFEVLS